MQATTKDLRLHTRELIAATDRGEEVLITFRGEPRAILSPVREAHEERSGRNPLFGIWADKTDTVSVDEQVRQLRKPRSFD